jgi:hypothetical protein
MVWVAWLGVGSVGREQAVDCVDIFIRKDSFASLSKPQHLLFVDRPFSNATPKNVSVADRAQVNNLVEREARSP